LTVEVHGGFVRVEFVEHRDKGLTALKMLGRHRIAAVHVHEKIRVLGEQRHLTGGVASIGTVSVGVNQFPDRQPVGYLLQRQIGMLAAPELPRWHCLLRSRLERRAHGLIVAITSAGVDVLPNTP
jgi:hypothetical protein